MAHATRPDGWPSDSRIVNIEDDVSQCLGYLTSVQYEQQQLRANIDSLATDVNAFALGLQSQLHKVHQLLVHIDSVLCEEDPEWQEDEDAMWVDDDTGSDTEVLDASLEEIAPPTKTSRNRAGPGA